MKVGGGVGVVIWMGMGCFELMGVKVGGGGGVVIW